MKNIIVPKSGQHGSILLVSLVITFIIGTTLASYLVMTQSQNVSVVRSQTWNASLALSEAGVEDALAMLNKNKETGDSLYNWTNGAAASHWEKLTASLYHVRRYIGSNYYDAYITNLNDSPTLFSAVVATWTGALAAAPQSFYAAAGVGGSSPAAIRKLQVNTHIDPSFNVAMAAKKTIDFNGKNIKTDSFDSGDQGRLGPWFGWFSNRLKGYPETLNLKCQVRPRSGRQRPLIELEPTEHPLAVEQRDGITIDRLLEIYSLNGHDLR